MTPPSGPIVRARSLRKRFRSAARSGAVALDDIHLDAGPGVTIVAGTNGAGKTTLLSVLLGFLHPTSGTATIDGGPPHRWIRRHGAGYVPERFDVPPAWSTAAALRALARLSAHGDHVGDVVDRFGLAPLARRRVGSLSRGERQRFALAQAAVGAPALQVLDEPEQGLDVAGRATLAAWVRERRAEGATILLSTHDLDLAADLGDRALILDAGRRIATLTAEGAERRPVGYRVTLAAPHPALSEIVEATRSDEATGSPGGVRAGDGGGPGPERESGSALPAIDRALLPIDDEHALALCLARLIDAGARPILVEPAASRWQTRLAAALAPDSEEAPAAARGP